MLDYFILANTILILLIVAFSLFKEKTNSDVEIIDVAKSTKKLLKSFSKPPAKQKPKVNDDSRGWEKENGINN